MIPWHVPPGAPLLCIPSNVNYIKMIRWAALSFFFRLCSCLILQSVIASGVFRSPSGRFVSTFMRTPSYVPERVRSTWEQVKLQMYNRIYVHVAKCVGRCSASGIHSTRRSSVAVLHGRWLRGGLSQPKDEGWAEGWMEKSALLMLLRVHSNPVKANCLFVIYSTDLHHDRRLPKHVCTSK